VSPAASPPGRTIESSRIWPDRPARLADPNPRRTGWDSPRIATMRAAVRSLWADAAGDQRLAYLVGACSVAIGLAHAAIWALAGGSAHAVAPEQDPATRHQLSRVATSFGRFPPALVEALLYLGWWLCGAALAAYHRELLPDHLPSWRPLPGRQ
jgi:hypothetical protein